VPYQAPVIKGVDEPFLDVKATLNDDTTVIIEIQVINVPDFRKQVLYSAAKVSSTQLKKGDDYTLLNAVIVLTITDLEIFEDSESVISRYRLKEKDDLTEYSDDIELVFAELPKFKKSLEELSSLTDKWLYFLKEANYLETVPHSLGAEAGIQKAFDIARHSQLTQEELDIFEKQAMFIHDSRNAVLLGIQQGQEKGLKQGLQQGLKQGQEKGLKQGIEQGEKKANLKIARTLIGKLPTNEISQITGLTAEEIEKLSTQ